MPLKAAADGAHTVVVCATRGDAGEVRDGVEVPPDGVGALREAELRAAAQALGVAEVEVLGFADSGMEGEAPPGSLCAVPASEVVAAVTHALERYRPDVVVTLAADDGHRDHATVRDAVLEAVQGGDHPHLRVQLHCLPRSLMHAGVRSQGGNDKASACVVLPDIGTPDEELTTVVDTSVHYQARSTAIDLHASQSSPSDGLPEALRRAFLGTDHLVRAHPVWSEGERESALWG